MCFKKKRQLDRYSTTQSICYDQVKRFSLNLKISNGFERDVKEEDKDGTKTVKELSL